MSPVSHAGRLCVNALSVHRPGRGSDRVAFVPQKKNPPPPKSCPVCHETYQPQGKSSEEFVTKSPKNIGDNFWLKKGTFKTIPNSHTVDRKSTRLNSSHSQISYAVFCLKKKNRLCSY